MDLKNRNSHWIRVSKKLIACSYILIWTSKMWNLKFQNQFKKICTISGDCNVRHDSHLDSGQNHISTYFLNFKKEVSLFEWFHIFGPRAISEIEKLAGLTCIKNYIEWFYFNVTFRFKNIFHKFWINVIYIVFNISVARVSKRLTSIVDLPLFFNNAS